MMKKLLYLALLMPLTNFGQVLSANFDDGVVPPDGWSFEQTNADETWKPTLIALTGAGSATVSYDPALVDQNERLITPSVNLTGFTTVSLKFTTSESYYWSVTPNNFYDTFVEVSTDGGLTWNQVWSEIDLGVFTSFVSIPVTVDLSSYAGNSDVKIAFHYVGNNGADWTIDDVSIVTCLSPTSPALVTTTATSASVTWAGTSANYEVEYGVSGFTQGSGTVVPVTSAAYAFSNLEPSTTYQYYVRSICSANSQSEWLGPIAFTTVCEGAAEVPMTEDFESAVAPALPACSSTQNVGTGNDWAVSAITEYGFTTKHLRYKWSATSAANTWFFTKSVNLTAGQSYTLTYKYGNTGTTYVESLKVSLGMGANAAAMSATPLADHPAITNNTPNTNSVTFTPDATGAYNIGFNAYSIADRFYLFVDDITIDVALGTKQFDASQFDFFPNPVKDVLNLAYSQPMSSVEVYNMLGQKVVSEQANANQKQINMSGLSAGSYMVKVYSGDMVKTIKVVKQ